MGGAETFITEPGLMALENPGLYDMGPHLFDLARFFFGEPQSVYCQTYRSFGYLKGENIVCSLLRFGDLSCVCEISDIVPYNVFVEGEEGSLVLGTDDSVAITTKKGTDVRRYPSPHYPWVSEYDEKKHGIGCINGIVQCNASLFNAIRTGQPAETSAEESLKTMRIVNAALDSSKCVKVIKMDLSVCSLQKQMC